MGTGKVSGLQRKPGNDRGLGFPRARFGHMVSADQGILQVHIVACQPAQAKYQVRYIIGCSRWRACGDPHFHAYHAAAFVHGPDLVGLGRQADTAARIKLIRNSLLRMVCY